MVAGIVCHVTSKLTVVISMPIRHASTESQHVKAAE